jgi:hypothetical protein
MRYLKTFESFKLLLEKIVKDDDYYAAREDLHPHAEFILDEFRKLNQKIRSSVSVLKKGEDIDQISKSNMSEIRSQLASIFYKVMKDIHGFDLPEDFLDKLSRMVGTTFDKEGNLRYLSFTIGSMGQEGGGEFVNFPIKNIEVSGKTISEIDVDFIGKKPLIKIIEFLNELVFSIISPEDPKKLEIKKLLKSGEDPKKVAKKYKLSPEELKELIAQAQGQIESEEIQSTKEDLLKLKEKPKLDLSSEDKKIIDVEEMIEEFREFGKEFFKSNSTDRVNFDIQVDKFKLFLQKKGYQIPIRGDFKQTISTLLIDELKNPNSIYKQFLEMSEFMNICLQSSSKKIEKYRIKGIIKINGNNLSIEKTSNSGLGIWKDSDGKPIYDKGERLKMGMSTEDKCEIKTLFPSAPLGKDKIKLGKKSIRSGSMVNVTGFGLSPLIVVSEDDINFA